MNNKKILKFRKNNKVINKIIHKMLFNYGGMDIPSSVIIDGDASKVFQHNGFGVVIHPNTKIGKNCKIYQGVTIGRADIFREIQYSEFKGIKIDDNVIIGAGAKILCNKGILHIGKNAIIGANAVVTENIGENEIWAGVPAKKIGIRKGN